MSVNGLLDFPSREDDDTTQVNSNVAKSLQLHMLFIASFA